MIICGVSTNYCVMATAIDGFHLGFNIIIPSDCVGASSQKKHESALELLGKYYAKITTVNDFDLKSF